MIAPVANGRGKGTFKILSDLDAYKTALDRKKGKEWLRGFAPAAWQVIFCRRALAPGVDISSVNPERTRCRVVAGESSPALPPAFHNDASGCRWRLPSHLLMLSQKGVVFETVRTKGSQTCSSTPSPKFGPRSSEFSGHC
jgi:hypothetical protein